jgi:hypothetical protein
LAAITEIHVSGRAGNDDIDFGLARAAKVSELQSRSQWGKRFAREQILWVHDQDAP